MSALVFDRCEAQTAQDIQRLEERRNTIFDNLQPIYESVKQLLRKEPLFEDLEPFLDCEADRADIQERAFERFLKRIDDKLGILPRHAAAALGKIPDDVLEVVGAWEQYYNGPTSIDPKKYWSDTKQKFRPLPVTEKEKEGIAARNIIYVKDQERAQLLDYARLVSNALNYASEHHHIKTYPGSFFEDNPHLQPLITWEKTEAVYGKRFVFMPKVQGLTFRDSAYTAFDEG